METIKVINFLPEVSTMAGFYVHIPLCKQVCYYCDFHFVASLKNKDRLISAIIKEIQLKSYAWKDVSFDTLYFGGGTPSILSASEINKLTDAIFRNFRVKDNAEFTLEANPDDLSPEYLDNLRNNTTVNRLSIGVQSFIDKDLSFLNRRHNGNTAIRAVQEAKMTGFDNITIDLIYGIPGLTEQEWLNNIEQFFQLDIDHLAAYHLSIEPKTVFGVFQKQNKISPVDEKSSLEQYYMLINELKKNGYEHYELANFARNKKYSKHNLGYWMGEYYVGIGPSAHSYHGNERNWNITNNTLYCKNIADNEQNYCSSEILSMTDRFNEYLLTSLRTMWGADLGYIKHAFGNRYYNYLEKVTNQYLSSNILIRYNNHIKFTEKGWFVSDGVLSELFHE